LDLGFGGEASRALRAEDKTTSGYLYFSKSLTSAARSAPVHDKVFFFFFGVKGECFIQ
jgi:hypothetical protein